MIDYNTPLAMMTIGELLDVLTQIQRKQKVEVSHTIKETKILDLYYSGEISGRLCSSLIAKDITKLGDLLTHSRGKLMQERGMGKKTFNELLGLMEKYNLKFLQ